MSDDSVLLLFLSLLLFSCAAAAALLSHLNHDSLVMVCVLAGFYKVCQDYSYLFQAYVLYVCKQNTGVIYGAKIISAKYSGYLLLPTEYSKIQTTSQSTDSTEQYSVSKWLTVSSWSERSPYPRHNFSPLLLELKCLDLTQRL